MNKLFAIIFLYWAIHAANLPVGMVHVVDDFFEQVLQWLTIFEHLAILDGSPEIALFKVNKSDALHDSAM
jgi:hypothetical protein